MLLFYYDNKITYSKSEEDEMKHIIHKILIFFSVLILVPSLSLFAASSMLDTILSKFDGWDRSYENALKKSTDKRNKEISKLTDEILEIVGQSEAVTLKNDIIELREEKSKIQEERDNEMEALLTAPDERPFFAVWVSTSDKIQSDIDNLEDQLDDLDYEIVLKKSEIQELFMDAGIKLSISDIDVITSASYGNDVLNLIIVGQNINSILNQYRDEIIATKGQYRSISLFMKYYQLYRLSVVTQIRAIDIALLNLEDYQHKLTDLIADNTKLMNDTMSKLNKDSGNKESYEANLESQRINESVMINFKSLLESYETMWTEKREELVLLQEMVQNTIDTVLISDEVSNMIGETLTLIENLNSVQIGEILPFDNTGLEKQFEELSLELSKK